MKWKALFEISVQLVLVERVSAYSGFRVLYPQHPLKTKAADEPYELEYLRLKEKGISCSLFDFDKLEQYGEFRPLPAVKPDETVLYRGWMMTPPKYQELIRRLEKLGAHPITSVADYTRCHHLPGWYKSCADLTAETRFFDADDNVAAAAAELGWEDGFFVKDYVKSNTGDKGSIAQSPADVSDIIDQLKLYRGDIEGGIALRKVEHYKEDSEQRFFVVKQRAYGPTGEVPPIVQTVAETVKAPFYSVDIAQTEQGDWRVVELGDGQVSDKKEWPLDRFVDEVLLAMVSVPDPNN